MYTYIIMLLISLFFAFILMEVKKLEGEYISYKAFKIKRIYTEYLLLFLSMLPFILISGLRRDIGYDYGQTYVAIFDYIAEGGSIFNASDIGYSILNKIIIILGGGYVWLFLITTTIIIAFFWVGIYEQSKNICMSIITFFVVSMFFLSMDAVRQYMGLAISFYAFKYIEKKSFFKFAIIVIFAASFHKSMLIMLPLYFLQYIKLSPIVATALIAIGSVLHDYADKILTFLISLTGYSNYVASIYNNYDRIYLARVSGYLLMFVIASVFYYRDDNKNNKLYRVMYGVMTVLTFISLNADVIPAPDRFCFSLEIILLLLVPFILASCKNKYIKYGLALVIIATFSRTTYQQIVVMKMQGVVPYIFTFAPYIVFP